MICQHVLVAGAVAKEFFEKSKLPVQELSKIWYCSFKEHYYSHMKTVYCFFLPVMLTILRFC